MIKIYFHTNDTRQNITFHKKDDISSLEDSCLPQKEMNRWISLVYGGLYMIVRGLRGLGKPAGISASSRGL